MIERARRGRYGERSFRNLPAPLRARYFEADGPYWRVDPRLHERIVWTTANLVEPAEIRPLAAAQVIFCRNVFIYFSDETVARVNPVAAAMSRGCLNVSSSESMRNARNIPARVKASL